MIDFAAFFGEVNRRTDGEPMRPHDWQSRLAARLAAGEPPRAITVPTGGGKTSTIDALVWALAAQATRPAGERTIGVRTVWAIDRRIVVDEVHDRARRIAERLQRAVGMRSDPLYEVADVLRSFTDGFGPPLMTTRWRGQVRTEPRAHHPLQPEIITSTVAQVGSRLLFRGYGVGERSLAVEAALCAVDCTLCLDEAHLAEPFRQTVSSVRDARAACEPGRTLGPLTVMTLSATPAAELPPQASHTVGEADESSLARRLDARKSLILVDPQSDRDGDQVEALADEVQRYVGGGGATRIVCVVNTVQLAVTVHERLARLGDVLTPVLLVGPQRPWDRARLLDEHRATIFARQTPAIPLVVVATQTIEVGLDADFDAMVTQSASATAIVQRLGRLNRAGLDQGRGTIVRHTGAALYEQDEARCWEWLEGLRDQDGVIDGSPRALAIARPPTDAVLASAPVLTGTTIDLLQQTAPRPARLTDPAIEPFLRGVDAAPAADVFLCWRADLRLDDIDADGCAYREAVLRLAAPRAEELVTIGLRRLHALLRARFGETAQRAALAKATFRESDVEGGAEPLVMADDPGDIARFVVVRDGETLEAGLPAGTFHQRDVRPGDVVVLSSGAGGYASGALAPSSSVPVEDIGNEVALATASDRPVGVRLAAELRTPDATMRLARRSSDQPDAGGLGTDGELLSAAGIDGGGLSLEVRRTSGGGDPLLDDDDDDDFGGAGVVFEDERSGAGEEAFVLVLGADKRTDLVRPSRSSPPTLDDHASSVAERVTDFTRQLRDDIAAAVIMAAKAHDHGKADDRFQAFFRGGASGVGDALLAKSVFGVDDRRASRQARRYSGLPSRLRHEIASVAVLAQHLGRERPDNGWPFDEELALHLIGTHHGLGRPWPRCPVGGIPAREFAVNVAGIVGVARGDGLDGWHDGAWLRRFVAVTGRYGAWGAAYLEAVLVLADRTVSSEGG